MYGAAKPATRDVILIEEKDALGSLAFNSLVHVLRR